MWLEITTACIVSVLVIYHYLKHVFTYWSRNGVYQLPTTIPFGSAWPVFWNNKHPNDLIAEMYLKIKSEGKTVGGFYFLNKRHLLITDPDHIKHVLATDFSYFRNRGVWCHEHLDPLSLNLFQLPAERWKEVRSKLSPFFSPSKLKNTFATIEACGSSLIEVASEFVDNNEPIDIKDLIWRFTSTVIGTAMLGYESNSIKDPNDMVKLVGKDIFEPKLLDAWRRNLFFFAPDVLKFLRQSGTTDLVGNFFMNLTKDCIDYRDKNNVTRADLMQILMDCRKQTGEMNGLSVNEMAAQAMIFFGGSFDTTATLTTFCLLELSQHTNIQDKVRNEIEEVLKSHDGKFTYDSLAQLKYTEQVVKETLRKYPSLGFLNRECSDTYKLPNTNVTLRKGDSVIISTYAVQRDPDNYPDPEVFDPDRFNEDYQKVNPYIFLTFGEGPRNCIGLRMGMIQGKYAIALMIKNFKFSINEKTQWPIKQAKNAFAMSIEGRLWLNAEKI